ncbi:MAG: hypothetical protein R3F61_08750 [Myxococcota bacterium]
MSDALPYTATNGGPVLLLTAEHAPEWGQGPLDGGFGSHRDYDRACEPNDLVYTEYGGTAWVEVGDGIGLILAGQCHTQWLALSATEGVLYREGSPDITEARVREQLARVESWKPYKKALALASGHFFLLDAAFSGAATLEAFEDGAIAIEGRLDPGVYQVLVGALGGIDLIRLVPA